MKPSQTVKMKFLIFNYFFVALSVGLSQAGIPSIKPGVVFIYSMNLGLAFMHVILFFTSKLYTRLSKTTNEVILHKKNFIFFLIFFLFFFIFFLLIFRIYGVLRHCLC